MTRSWPTKGRHRSRARTQTLLRVAAIPAALLVASISIWQASYAAFTMTTDSTSNSWAVASISLTNDVSGSYVASSGAMFSKTDVMPGDTGSWCVNVKNESSIAASASSPIKLHLEDDTGANLTGDVAGAMTIQVEAGSGATGGASGDCTSFTNESTPISATAMTASTLQKATPTTVTTTLAESAVASYRITWALPSSAASSLQGQSLANVKFVWSMSAGS